MSNPHTMMAVTHCGGHIAFLEGLWPFGGSWVEKVVMEFMQAWDSVWPTKQDRGRSATGASSKPIISASKL